MGVVCVNIYVYIDALSMCVLEHACIGTQMRRIITTGKKLKVINMMMMMMMSKALLGVIVKATAKEYANNNNPFSSSSSTSYSFSYPLDLIPSIVLEHFKVRNAGMLV